MLRLNAEARDCADSAALITGSARSGTTIVGKLVHSFDKIEYTFEPPSLIALIPLIDHMPKDLWEYLYESYLYEEFLVNAIAGRSINTNIADDSSIYASKGEEEIAMRLNKSLTKDKAIMLAKARRVVFKIPNIVPTVDQIVKKYPSMQVIMVIRNAVETIHSLIAKKPFDVNHNASMLAWPYRLKDGKRVPYWVRTGDEALWIELNEIDRCAYYYILMNENIQAADHQYILKYSELIDAPMDSAKRLANFLEVDFGEKTPLVIGSIKPTGKILDRGIINKISNQFRMKVVELSSRAD